MTSSAKRKIGALVLAAGIGLSVATTPADAATKKKNPKATTTRVAKVAPTLVPPPTTAPAVAPVVAPPTTAPAVAPVVAPPSVPSTAPPATVSVDEANRQAFERMWAARDNWRFVADVELSAAAEELRRSVNSGSSLVIWTASQARAMETVSDGKFAALVFALVADPALIRPEILQRTAVSVGRSLRDVMMLKIPNGTALVGLNPSNNLGVAVVAFDQYLIQVIAPNRQLAQDAAFVVSTNMGRLLTE